MTSTIVITGESFEMTALERRLLYETALQTGFRTNELRSLTCAALNLKSDKPFIKVGGKSTKNSDDAYQFIHVSLAKELAKFIKGKSGKILRVPDVEQVQLSPDVETRPKTRSQGVAQGWRPRWH